LHGQRLTREHNCKVIAITTSTFAKLSDNCVYVKTASLSFIKNYLVDSSISQYAENMPKMYCLLLPQTTRAAITESRTTLFKRTGESSFRVFPPCIILGETESSRLLDDLTCPPLPIFVTQQARFEKDALFFPVEGKALQLLQEQLGVTHPFCGIFLGRQKEEIEATIPPIKDLRLALLEYEQKDGLTLWRILCEKHLQRDKG
jgi:hypothetical protein